MQKITVATDSSDQSKAALLFAILLPVQTKCSLTFFIADHILTPTARNFRSTEAQEKEQTEIVQQRQDLFVEKTTKVCIQQQLIQCT